LILLYEEVYIVPRPRREVDVINEKTDSATSLLMVVGITAEIFLLIVNVNHSDIGRYKRPAFLTVGQGNAILGLCLVGLNLE
jgi:hypothetical protein